MHRPLVRSLACLTIATSRAADLVGLLVERFGWIAAPPQVAGEALGLAWGVSAVAGRRTWLVASPGATRGMIRVIEGRDRWPAKSIGARWSGAEIVVTRDIDGLHDALLADARYTPETAPADADFTDAGANVHRFFHGRPPGGTHLMLTAAVTEARDYDFPSADARVGHIFSVPLVTTDFAAERAFLTDVLGLVPVLEDRLSDGIWHRTWRLEAGVPVDLAILKGDAAGFGEGGIELQGYPAGVVDPVPADPLALDGGACLATFVAVDFDAAWRALSARPGVPCTVPVVIDPAPYAGGRAFAITTPGGARIEIAERFTFPAALANMSGQI